MVFLFLLVEGIDSYRKKARDKIHQENHNVDDRVKKSAKILEWDVKPLSTFVRVSSAQKMSRAKVPIDYFTFAIDYSLGNKGQMSKRYIPPISFEELIQYNSYLLDLKE